jgi:hypothetical protein
MKELGLQDLLRYALSGGIGLAVLLLTYPAATSSIKDMEASKETTLILGSVLLIGTLIYNLHRALLFPVLFRIVGLITLHGTFTWALFIPWWPSDRELRVDRWRWDHLNEKSRRWDEWGAQTHFLYCAAWAVLAALLLGKSVWGQADCRASRIFWPLFAITLLAGLVNNCRLLYSISAEMNKPAANVGGSVL